MTKLMISWCMVILVAPALSLAQTLEVPLRWCALEGSPAAENPGLFGEPTTDNVLWRRHERVTDQLFTPLADITFRSGATSAIRRGPQSFPIIRDPIGLGGILIDGENSDALTLCRRAWTMGDPLYFDADDDGLVDEDGDTLLSTDDVEAGFVEPGHDGAALRSPDADVRFVDGDGNGEFDLGERLYRDENGNGTVDTADTQLTGVLETVVGEIDDADDGAPLLGVPGTVKYLDLIREPADTFNIGYPAIRGLTVVNASDMDYSFIAFPVHGVLAQRFGIVLDDAAQYLPPGPDFRRFEVQLVAHELGHALGLPHGDGIDDDDNGTCDDEGAPQDNPAPFPGAGAATECVSNNVMSYCWRDDGGPGAPDMNFVGIDTPTSGSFTGCQIDTMRDLASTVKSSRVPSRGPRLAARAARIDTIGELEPPFEHLDIADFSVGIDETRSQSVFWLTTRRAIPESLTTPLRFHFLFDLDGSRSTGGSVGPLNLIPSSFSGVEAFVTVVLRSAQIESATLFVHDPRGGGFLPQTAPAVGVVHETERVTPDFPLGPFFNPPVLGTGGETDGIAVSERIEIFLPSQLIEPSRTGMRLKIVTHDPMSDVFDRARGNALRFDEPRFPRCSPRDLHLGLGETTSITASGLLPDRRAELFLGDLEIGGARTDSAGNVRMPLTIPIETQLGRRLVTLGSAAVTADCTIRVLASDCNDNGVEDAVDLADGTSPDRNSNGRPDECEVGRVVWTFDGVAEGGLVGTTIVGFDATCTVEITTMAGETAVEVADRFSSALTADGCLAAQGITASIVDATVTVSGFSISHQSATDLITDPGLEHEMPFWSIPALSAPGLALLVLMLAGAALLSIARRRA